MRQRQRTRGFFVSSWHKALVGASAVLSCLSLLLAATPAQATQGIPYLVNFQGRLTDNNGNILADGYYNIKFRIADDATLSGVHILWTETRDVAAGPTDNRVHVVNGLFSVQLGSITTLSPSIFNSSSSRYLEVELPSTGTNTCSTVGCASWTEGAFSPRHPLSASPYAFVADTLDGLDSTDFGQITAANSFTGTNTFSKSGGAGIVLSGSAASGGSILQIGSTLSSGNASGTLIGANGSFTGDLLNLQVSNSSKLKVDNSGNLTLASGAAITIGSSAGQGTTCSGGQFLQNQTTVGGIVTGGSCATPAGTGATTTLNNLGTTSINADLLPSADNTRNVGSAALVWSHVYAALVDAGSTTTTLGVGTVNATAITIGKSGTTTTFNGAVSVAGGQNLSLASGTGTFSQTYVNNSGTAATNATTDNASSGTTTVKAQAINLTGTDNASGSNTLTGLDFGNVTAHTNNTYTALNIGTGFSNLLTYNGTGGTVLIDGTGHFAGGQLTASSVANAALANSSLSVTASTGLSGGGSVALGGSTSLSVDQTASLSWTGAEQFNKSGGVGAQFNGSAASAGAQLLFGSVTGLNSGSANGTYLGANSASYSGDFINFAINSVNKLKVDNSGNLTAAGALVAVGVNSGTGLIQGTGGLTLTGTAQINASGSGTTTIGNTTGGALSLQTASTTGIEDGTTGTGVNIGNTTSNPNIALQGSGTFGTTTGTNNLNGNVTIATNKSLTANGSAKFQDATNSTTALQVQNSGGGNVLAVDTTGTNSNATTTPSGSNLIGNSSIEAAVAAVNGNWQKKVGTETTFAQDSTQYYNGANSLKIATSTAANEGTKQVLTTTLTTATNYTLSFYVKRDSATVSMTDLQVGYSYNGAAETNCTTNTGTINSNGWQKISCSFLSSTGGTPTASNYIYIRKTNGTTAETFYIDSVLLETDATNDSNYREGKITLQGAVVSPLVIQNSSNSTSALAVQNAGGTNVFNVDTTDTNLVSNPGFETNIAGGLGTGWTAAASTVVSRDTSQAYLGVASLKVVISGATAGGAQFNLNPVVTAASTTYAVSFYALLSSGTAPTWQVTYDPTGSAPATCSPSGTAVTGGWTRFQCSVSSATGPTTGGFIKIAQTNTAISTWYIDSVQMEAAASASAYAAGGIYLNGIVQSPTVFQNASNSNTAFQIQNTANANLFAVDTLNTTVSLGYTGTTATTNASTVNIANSSSATSAQTIAIGSNANASNSVTIDAGNTGTIAVGTSASAHTINIGAVGSTAASSTVNIANSSANQQSVNIGNQVASTATNIYAGSGNLVEQVTSGTITLQTTTTGAINLKPAAVDGTNIVLGTSDTIGNQLVLDTKTNAGDPTGTNGGMYYNSSTGRFRCYENSAWENCITDSEFGDGSDGTLTYDGTTTILGMAPASNVYTLTRDIYAGSITINNGVSIITSGYRIFATGTITNNGTIQDNGTTATGTGTNTSGGGTGAGGAGGYYLAGTHGSGGGSNSVGVIGVAASTSTTFGGTGGTGLTGTAAGGAGGTASAPAATLGGTQAIKAYTVAVLGALRSAAAVPAWSGIAGGTGGGGGGSPSTGQKGGDGGGGGGVVFIAARVIANSSGTISANGGNGANSGGTGGGGGGGGGGLIMIFTKSFTGNAATATHGNQGTGGTAGVTATDGIVLNESI